MRRSEVNGLQWRYGKTCLADPIRLSQVIVAGIERICLHQTWFEGAEACRRAKATDWTMPAARQGRRCSHVAAPLPSRSRVACLVMALAALTRPLALNTRSLLPIWTRFSRAKSTNAAGGPSEEGTRLNDTNSSLGRGAGEKLDPLPDFK
jgi:hypothetical protein